MTEISKTALPGGYFVLLTQDVNQSIKARAEGYHLKDTLLVLGPGQVSRYAFIYRRPTTDNLVTSVLTYGSGTFNIKDCRVKADLREFFSASGKPRSGMGHAKGYGMGDGYGGDKANPPDKGGRWPTNMVFIHDPTCRIVGTRQVTTGVAHRTKSGGKTFGGNVEKPPMEDLTYGEGGKETIPQFECTPRCVVGILDRQSGDRPSTLTGKGDQTKKHTHPSKETTNSTFTGGDATLSHVCADNGGASRFFPQFTSDRDFIDWIHVLIGQGM